MLAAPWTSRPALLERPWRPVAERPERPLFGPRRRQRVVLGAAAAAAAGGGRRGRVEQLEFHHI